MTEVKARLERVECTLRVSGAPDVAGAAVTHAYRLRNVGTAGLAPDKVQWEAYRSPHNGEVYESITVYGTLPDGDRWNVSWYVDLDAGDQPSWIPEPPAWYVDAVAELRAAAEDLSRERVSR